MKTLLKPHSSPGHACRGRQAMTLVETMCASGVFSLVVMGLVYTQMFCMRWDQLTNSKLGASDNSRMGYNLLTGDIRAAKKWYIGNGGENSFTACGNATNQIGNALLINYTTDTNSWVRYYFDTNTCQLLRLASGEKGERIVAQSLTNASGMGMTFTAQRYDGAMLADLQFKYVIVATLEFAQYQYPLTKVGPNYYYDYYRIQFKTTSHNFN